LSFASETELDWITAHPNADFNDMTQAKHPKLKIDLILIIDMLRAGKRADLVNQKDRE